VRSGSTFDTLPNVNSFVKSFNYWCPWLLQRTSTAIIISSIFATNRREECCHMILVIQSWKNPEGTATSGHGGMRNLSRTPAFPPRSPPSCMLDTCRVVTSLSSYLSDSIRYYLSWGFRVCLQIKYIVHSILLRDRACRLTAPFYPAPPRPRPSQRILIFFASRSSPTSKWISCAPCGLAYSVAWTRALHLRVVAPPRPFNHSMLHRRKCSKPCYLLRFRRHLWILDVSLMNSIVIHVDQISASGHDL